VENHRPVDDRAPIFITLSYFSPLPKAGALPQSRVGKAAANPQ